MQISPQATIAATEITEDVADAGKVKPRSQKTTTVTIPTFPFTVYLLNLVPNFRSPTISTSQTHNTGQFF
jgi:hypothetical protein